MILCVKFIDEDLKILTFYNSLFQNRPVYHCDLALLLSVPRPGVYSYNIFESRFEKCFIPHGGDIVTDGKIKMVYTNLVWTLLAT